MAFTDYRTPRRPHGRSSYLFSHDAVTLLDNQHQSAAALFLHVVVRSMVRDMAMDEPQHPRFVKIAVVNVKSAMRQYSPAARDESHL